LLTAIKQKILDVFDSFHERKGKRLDVNEVQALFKLEIHIQARNQHNAITRIILTSKMYGHVKNSPRVRFLLELIGLESPC